MNPPIIEQIQEKIYYLRDTEVMILDIKSAKEVETIGFLRGKEK